MDWSTIRGEILKLLYAFLAAVGSAAALAALQWLGAEIPAAIHWITVATAAYAGTHAA